MVVGLERWHVAVERMIDEPWRGRIKSFFQDRRATAHLLRPGGKVIISGMVALATEAVLEVEPFEFNPGRGFVVPSPKGSKIRIAVPELGRRAVFPSVGDHITCVGSQIVDNQWETISLGADTVIVPQFKHTEPLNVLHLFAGAYGGWTRAAHWLADAVPALPIAHELHVDHDERIMQVWSRQHGVPHSTGRAPSTLANTNLQTGICTGVDDASLLNAWPHRYNSVTSASPPCISWSQGGRQQGLNCSSGYAMIEMIMLAEIQQPLLLFLEGADSTVYHEHFPILEALLNLIGYHKVWQQVVHQHQLSHNHRSRWLAVWARLDLGLQPHEMVFELRAPPLVPWNDALNTFFGFQNPSVTSSSWIRKLWGCMVTLGYCHQQRGSKPLPPPLRYCIRGLPMSANHCRPSAPRTLVSRQHRLQVEHVMSKGIFAALELKKGVYTFMCPTRFVPLFGTTGTITLPSDAPFAFHILGNAISQSQATLCLAVGFAALFGLDVSPTMLVKQAWNDRLTSQNALVQVFEDWLTITRVQDIAVSMPCRSNLVPCEGHGVQLTLVHVPTHHTWNIRVPEAATLLTVFIPAMFTKGICPDALQFRTLEGQTLQDIPILEALALTSQVECLLWTFPLLWIRPTGPADANLGRVDPPADISPTVPFSPCAEEPLTLVLETVPPQAPSQELFQEMLHFLDFNAKWKDNECSNKQLVSLLWENTLGVLTLKLDATVPAADLQEQLATHFGNNQFAIYQTHLPFPRLPQDLSSR